jgi:transposase
MSLRPNGLTRIPAETSRVARAAFPKGCLAMRARDALGPLFTDEQFAELFAARGRPAWSPARLALVLQFVEGLTDRQAADAVRGRLDWKYALALDLGDPGVDASVRTEFRARLLADGQTERLLTLMLVGLRERGLLGKGGRQRTDATHVHMAVRDLHRLEQVIETLRAALEALAVVAPAWLGGLIPHDWTRRYGQRGDDWRLPTSEEARVERAIQVGRDGYLLLEAVYAPDAPMGLAGVEAVQVLRATWIQQFHRDGGQVRWRDKQTGLPPGSRMILTPYDLDARPGVNRGRNWRGYKAHLHRDVRARPAPPGSRTWPPPTQPPPTWTPCPTAQGDLAASDLLPDTHLVDAGYVSVGQILAAADDHGVQLTGPLPPDTSWQAGDDEAFDLTRFAIDYDARHVVCPQGKISRNWQPARSRDGLPVTRGHLPAAGLPPLPRPVTMHPLTGQRPARDLAAPPPTAGPAADQGRAGHRRLAPTLRTPMRRREPDLPSLPAQRRPPRPLPRQAQDLPPAHPHRHGRQPHPPRRLAHRGRNDRKLDLPTRQADPSSPSNLNSPAESVSWRPGCVAAAGCGVGIVA